MDSFATHPDPTGFLGVVSSLAGRRWRQRGAPGGDGWEGAALAQRLGLPEILGRLLAARGIAADAAAAHLAPRLRDHLPDPSSLRDMDKAAHRLATAITGGERIAIFGDYDVDGATSTALLSRFLRAVGAEPLIYIPDRRLEGYGPNLPALLQLKARGAAVVVTVDCGTTAHEPLAGAQAAGLDVIVIDHHAAEPSLPPCHALVNPNRLDDDSGVGILAAVGVAFLLIVAVNRTLRAAGHYQGSREPDLMGWLDLVALGTVCDVVPLTGINRALVAQGLKVAGQRANPGLVALADRARVAERLDAYHLGFVLGPRVNAGGRVGRADLGARLLSTENPAEAAELALALDGLNAERRDIEATALAAAIEQVEREGASSVVLAAGADWHPGIIGIVAARLKERYDRPACVISWDGEGEDAIGKGSGRSVAGFDLGAAIIAARQQGLLAGGGGHKMAAGFSLTRRNLRAFGTFLDARLGAGTQADAVPELGIDALLSPEAATGDFVETLARLGPFGAGNSEPRFALPNLRVTHSAVVGDAHVRCTLTGPNGGSLNAIAFRSLDSELGQTLLRRDRVALHIAGHLRLDTYRGGRTAQLFIEDAAFA